MTSYSQLRVTKNFEMRVINTTHTLNLVQAKVICAILNCTGSIQENGKRQQFILKAKKRNKVI